MFVKQNCLTGGPFAGIADVWPPFAGTSILSVQKPIKLTKQLKQKTVFLKKIGFLIDKNEEFRYISGSFCRDFA